MDIFVHFGQFSTDLHEFFHVCNNNSIQWAHAALLFGPVGAVATLGDGRRCLFVSFSIQVRHLIVEILASRSVLSVCTK